MILGYNTNGFAHHRLSDTIDILADQGYRSVAISLDEHCLNPFTVTPQEISVVRSQLRQRGMSCVVETGSRFLLDPRRKHWPTLISSDPTHRQKRFDFLVRCMDVARHLECDIVSFWSGAPDEAEATVEHQARLIDACKRLSEEAADRDILIGFEPEPGMAVATMSQFADLTKAVHHLNFRLTLDLGHLHCLADGAIPEVIQQWKEHIVNIHLEDMRRGVHDHLMLGEGEMDFDSIAQSLRSISYSGAIQVELSRHSHDAVRTAKKSLKFLQSHGF